MQIQIKATKIELTDAIRDYVQKKVDMLEKYIGDVLLQNKELPGTGVTRIKGDRLNFWGQPFGTDKQYLSLPLTFPNTANISVSFWFKPNTQFINVTTDQTIIKRTSVFEIMIVGAASSTEKENLKVKVLSIPRISYILGDILQSPPGNSVI